MTFTEAAAEVLRQVGRPLHYKEITAYAIERSLLSHVGKSPEVTMGARLAALFKKQGDENPLIRIRPGVFALKEWEESGQLKQMIAKTKAQARTRAADVADAEESVESAVSEPAPASSEPLPMSEPEPTEPQPAFEPAVASEPAADEPEAAEPSAEPAAAVRELVVEEPTPQPLPAQVEPEQASEFDEFEDAEATDEPLPGYTTAQPGTLFDEEDDDDQPILGTDKEGNRRRRRRRRRSKTGHEMVGVNGSAAAYSAAPTVSDSDQIEARPTISSAGANPVVLEVNHGALESLPLDDFAGKDMADAIATILSAFDRGAGPVSLRQIAEAAQRRGRLAGDMQMVQSQVAAAVRADNMRRIAGGQRPRFRFVGGRIALTDWLLTGELPRLEQEALAAVERYREAARKAFARKVQELPGHAFVELVLLVLERIGLHQVRAVRRAGIPSNEVHFTAIHTTGAADIPTALVVRRDGREIGRERVAELRGSLHHYGPATVGWLITSGPVLSGAREEAAASPSTNIVLLDGAGIAKLCEQHEVAMLRSSLPVAVPDIDMLEALRAS